MPLLALWLTTACAVIDRDNRVLLSKTDEAIQPKSTAARVALAPVAIPAASVVLAADAVVVHPARMFPKALDDTYQLYWKPRDYDILRKSLLFLPIVALTPPTFLGDWLMRSLFPIS